MKTCTKCGETKADSAFSLRKRKESTKITLRAECRECERKEARERQAKTRELLRQFKTYLQEAEAEKLRSTLALPRTFNHIKDAECWTGHTERQYIRNEGLKHIPSKGLV